MISFDSLPNKIPSSVKLLEKGTYSGVIEKAEMKECKSGKKRLSVTWAVKDEAGNSRGKFFDDFYDSDNDWQRYKIKCFMEAIGIEITPDLRLELSDLSKICMGRKALLKIVVQEAQNGFPEKNAINIFDPNMYAAVPSEASGTAEASY